MQSVQRAGQPLVAPCNMGPRANGVQRKLHRCPEAPLGVRPGEQRGA